MPALDPRAEVALDAHLFYMRELTRAGGGQVVERDGGLCFRAVGETPFLINGVARIDRAASPSAVIRLAREVFGGRGFELICLGDRDEDVRDAAIAVGMEPGGAGDPLQHIGRRPTAGPADAAQIEVRLVADAGGVADVAAVNQDASDIYKIFPADFFAHIFSTTETAVADHLRVFVGYEDGQPVATAQYVRYRDLCYVGWVGVVQRAMRRGLGGWITAHAVNAGFDDGVTAAVLVASPMGAPLYRRMGFTDIGSLNSVYSAPVSDGPTAAA